MSRPKLPTYSEEEIKKRLQELPGLSVSWAKVGVKLMTHSENGITDKDFELARKIEEGALWRPASGSALEGTPNKFVMGQ